MPKKFATENPKAAAARERKQGKKDAEAAKKKKEVEDAYWKDDDKQVLKKQQRKDEMEKKKQQQLEKKAELKALLDQEMSSIKSSKPNVQPTKITRAQINRINEKSEVVTEKPKLETHLTVPLEENVNRLKIEGEEARSIEAAITILSSEPLPADIHPEKRMKAAYAAFEEQMLAELKIEYPNLRLSQLKQMVFKEWQKSPKNPLNQQ